MSFHRPRPTLRQKIRIDPRKTDAQLFGELPVGDVWEDAKLVDVYKYLRSGCYDKIPDSWHDVMAEFDRELGLTS